MGRHKGEVERIHTATCEWCGCGVIEGHTTCSGCRIKLKLIREIQQMIRDTFERVRKDGNI
jgi:hypothetical protein